MRYVAHTPQDLLCPLCNTVHEDKMHILFYCKSLEEQMTLGTNIFPENMLYILPMLL